MAGEGALGIAELGGEAPVRGGIGHRVEVTAKHVWRPEVCAAEPTCTDQLLRLLPALVAMHSEMGADDVERASCSERRACPDRTARLGIRVGRGERRDLLQLHL